jgi:outer membrane murein-binding lipoprotein Lpp
METKNYRIDKEAIEEIKQLKARVTELENKTEQLNARVYGLGNENEQLNDESQKRKRQELIEMFGTIDFDEDYNYKKARAMR